MATPVQIPAGLRVDRLTLSLLNAIIKRITETSGILWTQIDFTGSTIEDVEDVSISAAATDQILRRNASGVFVNTDATATTSKRGFVVQTGAIADLNQTITNPPTQAEVQAISNKIDALLAAMRTSGQLET